MKFEAEKAGLGIHIPASAMLISDFGREDRTEYHTLQDAVVVLKKQMTAMELIHAISSLGQLAAQLWGSLTARCRSCDNCGGCEEERDCPYDSFDFAADIRIPDEFLERAGIASDAPLHVERAGDGSITVSAGGNGSELWNVPAELMQCFLDSGICPGTLEDLLEEGGVIYGI